MLHFFMLVVFGYIALRILAFPIALIGIMLWKLRYVVLVLLAVWICFVYFEYRREQEMLPWNSSTSSNNPATDPTNGYYYNSTEKWFRQHPEVLKTR